VSSAAGVLPMAAASFLELAWFRSASKIQTFWPSADDELLEWLEIGESKPVRARKLESSRSTVFFFAPSGDVTVCLNTACA
jgi:hypothetical protein